MRIVIVDDEPLALEILQHYIARVPGLELAASCSNAMEAFAVLTRQDIDLLLLDINMPGLSGVELLRSLKHPPLTVFTTAYSEFALTGYELNVVDYLMKPVAFERFLKAIQKAQDRLGHNKPEPAQKPIPAGEDFLFVKAEGRLVKIELQSLWLIEGLKDYVRLWTEHSRPVVHATMKGIEEQLTGRGHFVRVSKSYIVNLKYVTEIDGNLMRINGQEIVIGATYRDEVSMLLSNYRLL